MSRLRKLQWKNASRRLATSRRSETSRRRLFVEQLEDRRVLSTTFTVINTDDNFGIDPLPFAGTGTLRQAIVDANASPGPDLIEFNIPGTGTHKIAPLSLLPETSNVVIDATTQDGYIVDGLHPIELSGENLPWTSSGDNHVGALKILGDATIRGLTINRFFTGIVVIGPNNRIEANYVGTDSMGMSVHPVAFSESLNFYSPASMNDGIYLQGTSFTVIGGTAPQQRNVISGTGMALKFSPPTILRLSVITSEPT